MAQTGTFDAYLSEMLCGGLPFQKRGFLGREQVCEYRPIQVVDESAFFIGIALSLANRDEAEVSLTNLVDNAWLEYAPNLDPVFVEAQRLSSASGIVFQRLYTPEFITLIDSSFLQKTVPLQTRDLLSRDDCLGVIRAWVTQGTIFGWVLPRTAELMIFDRLRTPTIAQPKGIDEQHLASSFTQTLEGAMEIFAEWHREGTRNLYYATTKKRLDNLREDPDYAAATTTLVARYGELLAGTGSENRRLEAQGGRDEAISSGSPDPIESGTSAPVSRGSLFPEDEMAKLTEQIASARQNFGGVVALRFFLVHWTLLCMIPLRNHLALMKSAMGQTVSDADDWRMKMELLSFLIHLVWRQANGSGPDVHKKVMDAVAEEVVETMCRVSYAHPDQRTPSLRDEWFRELYEAAYEGTYQAHLAYLSCTQLAALDSEGKWATMDVAGFDEQTLLGRLCGRISEPLGLGQDSGFRTGVFATSIHPILLAEPNLGTITTEACNAFE